MSQAAAALQPRGAPRAIGMVKHFVQDQPIYREGDPAGHFMQVVGGVVRSASVLRDGRRFIEAFHVPGDLFGMEIDKHYARSAEAVCACSAMFYPSHDFILHEAIADGLPQPILAMVLRGLKQARDHARLLSRASAIEKTAAFLIEWSGRAEDFRLVTLAMTRQDIADYLGLSVETVSRCLTQLHRDGLIQILPARRVRLLNAAALRALAA